MIRKQFGKLKQSQFVKIDECVFDSVFVEQYQNGVFEMGGSEGYYYFTSKYEASLGKMKNGMHKDSILSLLGNPYREGKNIISFALVDYHIHEVDANNSRQHYEGLFLFFDRSMLFGILIKFPPGC